MSIYYIYRVLFSLQTLNKKKLAFEILKNIETNKPRISSQIRENNLVKNKNLTSHILIILRASVLYNTFISSEIYEWMNA